MIIKIKVVSGDEVIQKDLVVFDKNILVKSNMMFSIETFFYNYWQWLASTIFIPIIILLFKRKKKKKEEENEQ